MYHFNLAYVVNKCVNMKLVNMILSYHEITLQS